MIGSDGASILTAIEGPNRKKDATILVRMNRLRSASLAAVSVAVLITLACGGGTTTAPATPAPLPIAPSAAPTTVEIAPTVGSIPSALSVANAFLEAFNHGDLGALRSIYSNDIVVSFGRVLWWGSPSNLTGPEEVLESDREHIGLHAHYTLSNVRAEGNRVTSQFSYLDEELELFNFFPLSGSLEFIVEDGKITRIEQKLDEESKQRFAAGFESRRHERVGVIDDGWEISSLDAEGLDPTKVAKAVDRIEDGTFTDIDGLVIVRNGKLVHESYFNGFDRDRPHDLRSVTKSITSALVGIAIDKQFITDVNQGVLTFYPEYDSYENWDDRKSEITLEHLLTMSPGLECNDWNPSSPGNEDKMYLTNDWVKFILDLPMARDPGLYSQYCTGGVMALGGVISQASEMSVGDFAQQYLFGPLGITDYVLCRTPLGRSLIPDHLRRINTGSCMFLRPRDMAKVGLLFMNHGRWEGEQIISEEWIEQSTAQHVALPDGNPYGYLWWRRSFSLNRELVESFSAQGNGGQYIFVLPELDMVVVFTGSNYDSPLSQQPFGILQSILSAVR